MVAIAKLRDRSAEPQPIKDVRAINKVSASTWLQSVGDEEKEEGIRGKGRRRSRIEISKYLKHLD